jgi:hypothetical protein
MMDWSIDRLKKATLGEKSGSYKVIPKTERELNISKINPEIFEFEAISIGDRSGQALFIPLDESSKKTAEYILRAIASYKGK